MLQRATAGLPAELVRMPLRTVRPRDVLCYTQPRVQIRRLEAGGLLHRMADGYYAVVPQERVGSSWMPTLEGAAAGIAAADFGEARYALMGLSAARIHSALNRAVTFAVVAAPRRRRDLQLTDRDATIRFLVRNLDKLQVERMATDLGSCLVTTPEQTVLDLVHLPKLGSMEFEVWSAVDSLLQRCDDEALTTIAASQRLGAALRRIRSRRRESHGEDVGIAEPR